MVDRPRAPPAISRAPRFTHLRRRSTLDSHSRQFGGCYGNPDGCLVVVTQLRELPLGSSLSVIRPEGSTHDIRKRLFVGWSVAKDLVALSW